MSDDEAGEGQSSVLGTKEYWETTYDNDLENYETTEDSGEIWFGKACQDRIVKWLTNRVDIDPITCRILDLGCGNGALTMALRRNGFKNTAGIDYAESAIKLAQCVAEKEGFPDIAFQVCDLVSKSNDSDDARLKHSFDILVDKGTFDAIGLMENGVNARRMYKTNVIHFISPTSQQRLLLIASCNSTKDELIDFFSPEFIQLDEIVSPNRISFGGQSGSTVTTVVFQLMYNRMEVLLDEVLHSVNLARIYVNGLFDGLEPWQICAYTFAVAGILFWIYLQLARSRLDPKTRLKNALFRAVKRLPQVKARIAAETKKTRKTLYEDVHKCEPDATFHIRLPESGLNQDEILKTAAAYNSLGSYDYAQGRVSGAVYTLDQDLAELSTKIFRQYCYSNPLHPDVFPGCRKMEAEVVRMVADMFHGGKSAKGVVTSGGTESLLLACLAYRNRAYSRGIDYPEMVIPVTAHAAFDKAGEYLGIRVKHVPVDPITFQVDVHAMKKTITSNTCMLVASSPNYPHGIIDPVEQVAELGERYGIPVHVDACLGGFLIAFMEEAGFTLKPFDFRVPGVTSISCDTHKYAYAVKGTSVILYRSKQYLHHQYFSQPDWPGGIYASPTLAGSRSGANIAACWAVLLRNGRQGYVEKTGKIVKTARMIEKGLREIEGITVLGEPQVSLLAFTSYVFSVYTLSDRLTKLGWHLNALQFPAAIHICLTMAHTSPGVAEKFIEDTKTISAELMMDPSGGGEGKSAAIYGTAQKVPDRSIIAELSYTFLDVCYSTGPPTDDSDCE